MDIKSFGKYISDYLNDIIHFLPTLIGSIVLFIIGWWIIKLIGKGLNRLFEKKEIDISLRSFLTSLITISLKVLLFVMVISQLGIKTTSFIALLGAAGLAVGLALQGSLSNFAGGVILLILRPFRVGDFVETQNISGTVAEIHLFYTKITTITNELAVIPNALVSNGSIKNYSSLPTRKGYTTFNIGYKSDLKKAKEIVMEVMTSNDKILSDPAPQVFVSSLNESHISLSARLWATNEDFWDCHFETIENVQLQFAKAGIKIPFPQRNIHTTQENKEVK